LPPPHAAPSPENASSSAAADDYKGLTNRFSKEVQKKKKKVVRKG
jgi:hypothetical protein